ncbi:toll/interleukin-1 receptor domain-containing protein [Actinoplanes sp. NPDC026619]|uniref:toll/interleukin-1 receptor domain-containing protein n=1 Tax=Actinoplanes sp. NPDC026619 TaxID=3155798 RepID=UPI0033CAE92D
MAAVFISYRTPDRAEAVALKADLEKHGHVVWIDSEQIKIGDSIAGQIDQGLDGLDYLVLCYSSSGRSAYTDAEWTSTLHRQLSGHPVKILPARLTGGDPPAILAGTRYADLVKDWPQGVTDLCAAMA